MIDESDEKFLAFLEEKLDKITPGEWQPDLIENAVYTTIDGEECTVCVMESGSECQYFAEDIWFIAFAQQNIRDLIALVRKLSDAW